MSYNLQLSSIFSGKPVIYSSFHEDLRNSPRIPLKIMRSQLPPPPSPIRMLPRVVQRVVAMPTELLRRVLVELFVHLTQLIRVPTHNTVHCRSGNEEGQRVRSRGQITVSGQKGQASVLPCQWCKIGGAGQVCVIMFLDQPIITVHLSTKDTKLVMEPGGAIIHGFYARLLSMFKLFALEMNV